MNEVKKFYEERGKEIKKMASDIDLKKQGLDFLCETSKYNYSFNFNWLSRPIIQYPQDIVAFQEIVWEVKPDLIIEMGIAHGGSLIMSASMLAMIDLCERGKTSLEPDMSDPRIVLGVDIDIRTHNFEAIKSHPLFPRIKLIEGSSVDQGIIKKVVDTSKKYKKVLVCLDSNHTHEHVYKELFAYAPIVSKGSYCIIFDTVIEDMPEHLTADRDWSPGNSPKSAVNEYLKYISEKEVYGVDGKILRFSNDDKLQSKLLISAAPEGYLRRI